jgi:hypothetical protein
MVLRFCPHRAFPQFPLRAQELEPLLVPELPVLVPELLVLVRELP